MPPPQSGASRRVGRVIPLAFVWNSHHNPLPVREVRGQRRVPPRPVEVPPWIGSGDPGRPFDFSLRMRHLCEDIAAKCETLWHLDISRILFSFTPSRNHRSHGLQARVTPLRFRDGALRKSYRGADYQVQRVVYDGREILYLVTFCLPRFLDRDFEDKLVTIFHELYHIAPAFDGDLRRHHGRYCVHTASQKRYDAEMAAIAREYLQNGADLQRSDFLRLNHAQLRQRHGKVVGQVIPRPKLVPVRLLLG